MVSGIILSEIKIKIDNFMKASKNKNTSVKEPSYASQLSLHVCYNGTILSLVYLQKHAKPP